MTFLPIAGLVTFALALTIAANASYQSWAYDYSGGLDVAAAVAWLAAFVALVVVVGAQ